MLLTSLAMRCHGSAITTAAQPDGQYLGATRSVTSIQDFNTTSATMTGMEIFARYVDGVTASCVWAGVGGCVSSAFTVTEVDGSNGTYDGLWTPRNLRTAELTQLTMDGSGGRTVFDRAQTPCFLG